MADIDVVIERQGTALRIDGKLYPVVFHKNAPRRGWSAILEGFPGGLVGDGPDELQALVSLLAQAGWDT